MEKFEEKIKNYMEEHCINGEFLHFDQSCHSVKEAAEAAGADEKDFVKNICLLSNKKPIIAIVKGEDRASTKRIAKALELERVRVAKPSEILEKIGYPCGGVPSFGYKAKFLIDPRVMEKNKVYTSGGSEKSLIKIPPKELQKANKGKILRIRK